MAQLFRRVVLFGCTLILLGLFRLMILVVPFKWYAKRLTKNIINKHVFLKIPIGKHLGYARLIGRMVATVSRFTPWQSKCLVQSVTTKWLLRRLYIPNTLVIGVGFDEDQKFISHAWVIVNDIIVVGGSDSPIKYKEIKSFTDSVSY